MKEKKRIPIDGEPVQWKSPFAALKNLEPSPTLPRDKAEGPVTVSPASAKNRGRVDIIRQTAHRGGKTVTVVTGFTGIGQDENCLLYTSDAADERSSVDLGGRRIIKKKKNGASAG